MKYYILLSTAVLAVLAMPADIDYGLKEVIDMPDVAEFESDNEVFTDIINETTDMLPDFDHDTTDYNATLTERAARQKGWASFGGGTRGGQGGAVWTVWDAFALRDAIAGAGSRIVNVRGRIDLTRLFTNSPGVSLRITSYKSIIGGDRNAEIFGGGLRVSGQRQVIIENIRLNNALNYAPGERPNGQGGIISQTPGAFSTIDAIGIDRSTHVWVNHCELSDDPWNANNTPGDRRRHDGLLDITRGADLVSVSNSIFRNHNMVGLVGNDDNNAAEDGPRLRVTYYQNWFRGTTQRHPRVRFGRVHILNNLYTDIRSYGIGVGTAASIFVERNVFINTRSAWVWASSTGGAPNPVGNLAVLNNSFRNSGHASGIPSNVGWRPDQFYQSRPIGVADVEAYVRRNAGIR